VRARCRSNGVECRSVNRGGESRRSSEPAKLIGIYNREGIFTNRADDLEGLELALTGAFPRLDVETQGSFALFAAW
jgi:hypothetical protein